MASETKTEARESDLLVPFEIANIPDRYREYYRIKRNNFFSSIQGFPELWRYYVRLDDIWLREFEDLQRATDPNRMFPSVLYITAHAKIRVSIELAFSGCLPEARSVLRDAIEFVAHAHAMLRDPKLQKVWLEKNDDKSAQRAFEARFKHNKEQQLFKGLEELHRTWREFSEWGSHANLNAISDRFLQVKSEEGVEFKVNYTGLADLRLWALSLFSMLLTCFTMERTLFSDYQDRLDLDPELARMRARFEQNKEQLRRELIRRYNVNPPKSN